MQEHISHIMKRLLLVQCQNDLCTNGFKSLYTGLCTTVELRDYLGIFLFDTS